MYKSFEEENKKEVIENQVKMKIDLENLIADVNEQHKDLFLMLQGSNDMIQQNQTKGGSYSYGD